MAIVMYGVVILEAIASGDRKRMKKVLEQGEKYLAEHGDVSAALEVLKSELSKRRVRYWPGPIVLYGVAIHEAIASGDVGRMQEIAKEAEAHLEEVGDVSAALTALKAEINK